MHLLKKLRFKREVSILSTENVGHHYQDNWLFRGLTFGVQRNERIALVGKNGVGKSTLLKILAGIEAPKEGNRVLASEASIGYLEQEPNFSRSISISDYVFDGQGLHQSLIKQYNNAINDPKADQKEILQLTQKLTDIDAWEQEHYVKRVLQELGINNLQKQIQSLSGGEKKRLALAKLLVSDPDILILDEPTNHIDIDTSEWLENLLVTKNKTVIFVTHDRYFLDAVCTSIRELTPNASYTYNGNYTYFLEEKAKRLEIEATYQAKQKNLYMRELKWIRRQPKARGTKSKARIDAFNTLKQQRSTNAENSKLEIEFSAKRQGGKILEIHNLKKGFQNRILFENFSYVFKKGDRIGLAGKNGVGKSTFLNLITANEQADKGEVHLGTTTHIGYYKQSGIKYSSGKRVIDCLTDIAEYITLSDGSSQSASSVLSSFNFSAKKQYDLVEKLSGGEKRRLQLLIVLFQNPNFLILDEPSNDLDLETLEVLIDFLESYPGVLLLVSHDRYLLDMLSDQLFIFTGEGEIKIFNGTYLHYKKTLSKPPVKKVEIKVKENKTKKGRSYKEEREFIQLEEDILSIEKAIALKEEALNNTTDREAIVNIAEEIEILNSELDTKSLRWLELSEL